MCGFIGLVGRHDNIAIDLLKDVLAHRGPDAFDHFSDGQCLLTHHRLSIIDLSAQANQPWVNPTTGNVIVFNGEIYNYKELKTKYSSINWTTASDTEVILKLFEVNGPSFVHELNGIFAFAIYVPAQKKLLCYRDRLGIKPFYYLLDNDKFYFSSEIKGILSLRPSKDINYQILRDYIDAGLLEHNQHTFFKGIVKLMPGHCLICDTVQVNIRTQCYWDITHVKEKQIKDPLEEVYALLEDAVRINLVSDVEIGLSLSSGLDSTLLYYLLKKQGADRMRCFTYGFDEKDYDEVAFVKNNPAFTSTALHSVYLQSGRMLEDLNQAIKFFEGPLGGLGTLGVYTMMKDVRQSGIKVMLAGEGADEIFGGYKYYYPAYFHDIRDQQDKLAQELAFFNQYHGTTYKLGDGKFNQWINESVNFQGVRAPDASSLEQCLSSAYLKELTVDQEIMAPQVIGSSMLRRLMAHDLKCIKLPKLLYFQDRASMANSVETRVPFLDHRLVELMYQVPSSWLINQGVLKFLPKKILENYFNVQMQRKIKHYVATPQREWLKNDLYDSILQLLEEGVLYQRGLIDVDRFRQIYAQYRDSKDLGNSFFIWKMINLEYLLRRFF